MSGPGWLPRPSLAAVAGFAARWALRLGLALGGIAAMLALFPAHVTAAGSHFVVRGTIFREATFSADTTVGNWVFPEVDGLPVGVHVSPVNIDLLRIASAASPDPTRFAERLRGDLEDRLPYIAGWLASDVLIGLALGLGVAAAINLAVRQLRGQPRRRHELSHRMRQLTAVAIVSVVVCDIGVATYHPHWARQSRLTGTLAALALFPDQLQQYYARHTKALDVLDAISAIQSGLQQRIGRPDIPTTSYRIMFISDMHLAGTYPLVKQYAESFDVRLIVNTGDEAEFGTRAEMTKSYLRQLRAVTRIAPMIWLAGNHDSPTTVAVMRSVPNLTVLGAKVPTAAGGYAVAGQQMTARGLRIAAVPDPRVYGAPGAYGSNDSATVNPLEQRAVDRAVAQVPPGESWDIFATHEPVAAQELAKDLPGRIRQTNAGHLHAQNSPNDLQNGSPITLVEGSTGAGGLDNLNRRIPAPPLEFSIESVAADCEFTKIVRFQITGAAPASAADIAGSLPRVNASTYYFRPQQLAAGRRCGADLGLSRPESLAPGP